MCCIVIILSVILSIILVYCLIRSPNRNWQLEDEEQEKFVKVINKM